jgi:hypothetical protein
MHTRKRSYTARMVHLPLQLDIQWLTIRRSDLSILQRGDYIDAVLCLGKKPARTPSAIAAGAKSRHDDFVVTHIQQTRTIHFTVILTMFTTTQ